MSLESQCFPYEPLYSPGAVERFIDIIHAEGQDTPRGRRFLTLTWRTLKPVVVRNLTNAMNLLGSVGGLVEYRPVRDDLLADCWEVYVHCIDRYRTHGGFNFYFFFNKALGRRFYRDYVRACAAANRGTGVVADPEVVILRHGGTTSNRQGDLDLYYWTLGLTALERTVADSRIAGWRAAEWLKVHPDVTPQAYNATLAEVRRKVRTAQQEYTALIEADIYED